MLRYLIEDKLSRYEIFHDQERYIKEIEGYLKFAGFPGNEERDIEFYIKNVILPRVRRYDVESR